MVCTSHSYKTAVLVGRIRLRLRGLFRLRRAYGGAGAVPRSLGRNERRRRNHVAFPRSDPRSQAVVRGS